MPQYLLSVMQPEGEPPAPEVLQEIMRNVEALHEELKAAGAWVFAGGLHAPSTATVVRLQDGDVLTTDGPYLEGKEYLGGLSIIEAPDLDAALEWGRKSARATTLPIEVRPFYWEATG
ncbi:MULTISPECIES: YciI family protein [unclassified Streptomyces]|uniref:YciI family protein n=1 Tax=unclassified Streptomyces TaxID=2593676 RepID=UPI0020348AC3|nr:MULTISPECIES: YciI family protein [unclassified Streptomyces]MCM2417893.1 YciI family protein [Streptomyces sp. RKAG293]MCM2429927.1 YciI family protein [Streptomyces sp. RKAG337]